MNKSTGNTPLDRGRFSTVAELKLLANGITYELAQIAPSFVILRTPAELSLGPATLIVRSDDKEIRRSVKLVWQMENSTYVEIRR